MRVIVINELEEDALYGLPHEAQSLYRFLRWRMDKETGLVGATRKISYQAMFEALEVNRDKQSPIPEYRPTLKQLRVMIDQLIKADLLERMPKKRRMDPIVFRMLLVPTGLIRPREEGQKKGQGRRASQTSTKTKTKATSRAKEGQGKKGIHQYTNIREIPNGISWLPADIWHAFIEMRTKLRKPLTEHAVKLILNKLDKLRQEGHAPADVLNQSILNGWQGVFPVKDDERRSHTREANLSPAERMQRKADEARRRLHAGDDQLVGTDG